MPAISIPNIVDAASVADLTASKTEDANTGGNFSALLDIASAPYDYAGAESSRSRDRNQEFQRDYEQDNQHQDLPEAVAVDAPVVVVNNARPQPSEPRHEVVDATRPKSADTSDRKESSQSVSRTDETDTPPAVARNVQEAGTDEAALKKPIQSGEETQGDIEQPGQGLRDALRKQLAQVEQVLTAIIQALTGQAGANPVVPSNDGVQATINTDSGLPSSQAGTVLLSPTSLVPAGTTASPEEITLLTQIRDILRQMLDLLAKESGLANPSAAFSAGFTLSVQTTQTVSYSAEVSGQVDLFTLADALQEKVAALTQLLSEQAAAGTLSADDAVTTLGSALPGILVGAGGEPSAKPFSLAALIRDSISNIRSNLQQISQDNEVAFGQFQSAIKAQFAQAAQFFRETGAANTEPQDTLAGAVQDNIQSTLVLSSQAAAAATAQSPGVQAGAPEAGVPVVAAQAAARADVSQLGSQSGGSDSGYNHQGQTASPLSASSGTGQAQAGAGTGNITFARILEQQAAQPAPVFDQVTFQIKSALRDGSSQIRIQLEPADLGKVEIKLHVDASGKTGVVITADNRSTLDLLQRDSQGLARALADAGLATDSGSLSFNLRGGQQEQGGNQQAAGNYQKMQPEEEDIDINILTRSYVVNLAEGLDIKI